MHLRMMFLAAKIFAAIALFDIVALAVHVLNINSRNRHANTDA